MRRLGIVALGLALVVGIVVGGVVNNLFGASAPRTSAAAVTGSGCYTNWNDATCAPGFTIVSFGEWTAVVALEAGGWSGGGVICAAPKFEDSTAYLYSHSSTVSSNNSHTVNNEPCAICCATGSPSAVGGFAELPAVAGTSGSGMGGTTYAVLAGATAGVLAFAVLATLSVRRRGVR